MKKVILIFLLLPVVAYSSSGIPGVNIEYSPTMDSICALFKGYEIKDKWKDELAGKKVELESDWKKYGSKLLSTAESIVGKEFERKVVTAHLTLCNIPSRSFPVIINMRYALSSYIDHPVSIQVKTGTLFHELLHPYIDKNLPEKSDLLTLYQSENPRVAKHLHLLALLKAVYLELKLVDQLSEIIEVDSQLPGGYYKRAWDIVNSESGYYFEFVHELQAPIT